MADTLFIATEKPHRNDRIFIDANVLLFLTYPALSTGGDYLSERAKLYSDFIDQCQRVQATLFWCGLSLSEISHKIEEIHSAGTDYGNDIKAFRRLASPGARESVVRDVEMAWRQVESFGTCLDGEVTKATTDAALSWLSRSAIDGYDGFYLEFMRLAQIDKILTDDSDFSSVPNIIVFSANKRVCRD